MVWLGTKDGQTFQTIDEHMAHSKQEVDLTHIRNRHCKSKDLGGSLDVLDPWK